MREFNNITFYEDFNIFKKEYPVMFRIGDFLKITRTDNSETLGIFKDKEGNNFILGKEKVPIFEIEDIFVLCPKELILEQKKAVVYYYDCHDYNIKKCVDIFNEHYGFNLLSEDDFFYDIAKTPAMAVMLGFKTISIKETNSKVKTEKELSDAISKCINSIKTYESKFGNINNNFEKFEKLSWEDLYEIH